MTATAQAAVPFIDVDDENLTEEQLRRKYAPYVTGKAWSRNPDGSWELPERTLGWEVVGWVSEYVHDPNSDHEKPFIFTLEQLRWVLWWFAVDENGRFIYRTSVLQRMKGWGKDPLAAVLCLVEWVGPSRVKRDDDGDVIWGDGGHPLGTHVPAALVQIAAVSQSQTRNTTSLFPALISSQLKADYDMHLGSELFFARGRQATLQAVTSNYRTLEGGRATFIIANETHHWVSGNHGHQMWDTITDNATKMAGRYVAITNAFLPGEDSIAERVRYGWEKLVAKHGLAASDMLYDSLEAPHHAPVTRIAAPIILDMVRGDAKWLDIPSIMSKILDPSQAVARTRRMYYNQVTAGDDSLYAPHHWAPLEVETSLLPGEMVALGFDGGKTDDATALVAIRVSDHVAFKLAVWEKPDGPAGEHWEVPREQVDSAVHEAFRTYRVVAFYADVSLWESYIHEWSRVYGDELAVKASTKSPIGWDMRSLKDSTRAHEQIMRAIFDGTVKHDGDLEMRRHVLNARRAENNFGVSFRKESRESSKKVDLYAALMLAYTALRDYEVRGKKQRERTGRGWFF